jgi:hypothetical protein
MSGMSSLPKTALHPIADLAKKVDDGEVVAAERDLGYQSPKGDLKDVFAGGSYSSEYNYTDPRRTPCSPIYGAEACLPPKTLLDSPRV